MKAFFDNLSTIVRNPKQIGYTFYLDKIKELDIGREFSKLEAICTDGSILPPYPYQWKATSTMVPGDDDPFEGLGGSPLAALRELYKEMKHFVQHPPFDEDEQV